MSALPRISVITPALNAAAFIADAIESVASQDYPDVEHLVFDGGSTDGTAKVLSRYPNIKLVTGPDRGPHDAMNQGISLSSGQIIAFLNADDFFPKGTFFAVSDRFTRDDQLEIVGGASAIIDNRPLKEAQILVRRAHAMEGGLGLEELCLGVPAFNTRFFRRTLFRRLGNFDLSYSYAADRHFLIRARILGAKAVTLDSITCVFRSHENSRTIDPAHLAADAIFMEHIRMARELALGFKLEADGQELLRRWYAIECLRSAYRNLKRLRFGRVGCAFVKGFGFDPTFPVLCARAWKDLSYIRAQDDRKLRPLLEIVPQEFLPIASHAR